MCGASTGEPLNHVVWHISYVAFYNIIIIKTMHTS